MAALQRSYEFWSEKAKKYGFSPEEVVRMGRACHYVVVDPNDPTMLLPLSRQGYIALLHVTLSRGIKLIVLLGPDDARELK